MFVYSILIFCIAVHIGTERYLHLCLSAPVSIHLSMPDLRKQKNGDQKELIKIFLVLTPCDLLLEGVSVFLA
jgi:hypothetical protein